MSERGEASVSARLAVAVNGGYHETMKAQPHLALKQRVEAISVEKALQIVVDAVRPMPVIERRLAEAAGLILAEDVRTPTDLPSFRNSAMDGYALRSSETLGAADTAPRRFDVVGTIMAGDAGWHVPLARMTALRIMTGAPIPDEADAVVRFEDIEELDGRIAVVRSIRAGENVRERGSEVRGGELVVAAGSPITWMAVALLTALDLPIVRVCAPPEIAVISTGDELADARPHHAGSTIPDSNGPMLMELVRVHGALPRFLGIAGDSEATLDSMLNRAASADAIVISGGVSAGDRDVVGHLLARRNAIAFSQVRMKPGRPCTFGLLEGKPVFALPGNPLAAAATFLQFVRPAIDRMRGKRGGADEADYAIAASRFENPGKRRLIVPVRLKFRPDGLPEAEPVTDRAAGMAALACAGGLLVIPEAVSIVDRGDAVQVWRLPA
jgi:molybdopterin molybdotransferase